MRKWYLELHRLGLEIFETEKFILFINLKSLVTLILDVLTIIIIFFHFFFFLEALLSVIFCFYDT